jgi:hypothetical protein
MHTLIEQLKNPELIFAENFSTPEKANALLLGLCQDAAIELEKLDAKLMQMQGRELKLEMSPNMPTAKPAMNANSGTTYSSLPLDRKGVIHETSEVTVREVEVSDVVGGKTYFVSNGNGKLLEVALIVGPMNGDFYTIFIWDYMIGGWRDACYSGSLYEIEEAKLKENNV